MYDAGKGGLAASGAKAVELYRGAAAQGDRDALFNLALILDKGREDVRRDSGEAARLYRGAADAGDPGAQLNLGLMSVFLCSLA